MQNNFEHQLENAPRITVRERIGNPPIQPAEAIPLYALEEAVNQLLDLLAEQSIIWQRPYSSKK